MESKLRKFYPKKECSSVVSPFVSDACNLTLQGKQGPLNLITRHKGKWFAKVLWENEFKSKL